jgi:hypothetical protein
VTELFLETRRWEVLVQDRYAGDIGDFQKYALLKALSEKDLRLAVIWYLNPDVEGNADGSFMAYSFASM